MNGIIAATLQNTGIADRNAWHIQLKKGVFLLKVPHKLFVVVCFSRLITRTGDVSVLFMAQTELTIFITR